MNHLSPEGSGYDMDNVEKQENFSHLEEENLSANTDTAVKQNKKILPVKSRIMNNPVLSRIEKIAENEDFTDEDVASYKGIFFKFLFFTFMIFAGVATSLIMVHFMSDSYGSADGFLKIYGYMSVISLVSFIVCPLICSFFKNLTCVFGSIFSFLLGFTLSGTTVILEEAGSIIYLALIITLALVFSMLAVYSIGNFRLKSGFYKCFIAICSTYLISSLLILFCSFIPALYPVCELFLNNPFFVIVGSLLGVILGCLFLISDFESARTIVENRMDKKSEWVISFSILFSIIWLYLKVLSLILRFANKSKD